MQPWAAVARLSVAYTFPFNHTSTTSSLTMPRRSPSPGSLERHRGHDDRDKYRSRRDDGHRRGADRDAHRDRQGFSERDTRRGRHDNDNENDSRRTTGDGDDRHRRKNGFDSHEDDRRRRDEGGSRDRRYASRHDHDEGGDKRNDRSRWGEQRDRGDRDRLRDRDEREGRECGGGADERRGSPRRRSASPPRRSRPHSRSRSPSAAAASPPEDKTKPNFAPSGLLAAATNTVKKADGTSTLLKYNEPPEARKPLVGWRLYVFKGDEQVGAQSSPYLFLCLLLTHPLDDAFCWGRVDLLHIHRQSAYLIGRDPTVTDIPLEHPSCSKQHAVIQCNLCFISSVLCVLTDVFTDRLVQQKDEFGSSKGVIKWVPSSFIDYVAR